MSRELTPFESSELARDIYGVNENDELKLELLLSNPLFSETTSNSNVVSAKVGGRLFRSAKDSFGLMTMGSGAFQNDAFLIFRGTTEANNKADWVTDARIGFSISKTGIPVHSGFNQTFNSMLPEIEKFFSESKVTGQIHCIGHSLGGAIASLAADWVTNTLRKSVQLYTYGAPRVGTSWFSKSTTEKITPGHMYRVYKKTDPVPMVAIYPYVQAPYNNPGFFIPSSEPLTTGEAHSMVEYHNTVHSNSWEALSGNVVEPYNIPIFIENWLKSKAPVQTSSASFWNWLNAAMDYVIRKVSASISTAIVAFQASLIGIHTIADKLAYILEKGIHLAESISNWVILLMKKIMAALKMTISATKEILTRNFIRNALIKLTNEANKNASSAIKKIK